MWPADEQHFRALSKWERHRLGHSPGYLYLTSDRLQFEPHARSVLVHGFDVAVASIRCIERSDNWFWRGAINIRLNEPLSIEMKFRGIQSAGLAGFEQHHFHSDTLRLFLGFDRQKLFDASMKLGLQVQT